MEKPTFEQFGLTQMDFMEVKKRADNIRKTARSITALSVLIAIVFSTIYLSQNLQFDLFGLLFFVCFIGIVGGIIAGRGAAWLLERLLPRHPKTDEVEQYEAAIRQYDPIK